VKKRASEKCIGRDELGGDERIRRRAVIKVDSTAVRSTQEPLICTRFSEEDIIKVVKKWYLS